MWDILHFGIHTGAVTDTSSDTPLSKRSLSIQKKNVTLSAHSLGFHKGNKHKEVKNFKFCYFNLDPGWSKFYSLIAASVLCLSQSYCCYDEAP